MGEFETWVFRSIAAVALIIAGDYLKTRLSMSEKYVLKTDCKENRKRLDTDMATMIKSNREDHKAIETKLDNMMNQIIEMSKGINRINGGRN
jgi:GTP-binding protein EngB required for normal cell division